MFSRPTKPNCTPDGSVTVVLKPLIIWIGDLAAEEVLNHCGLADRWDLAGQDLRDSALLRRAVAYVGQSRGG
jgi:hypothetical protein